MPKIEPEIPHVYSVAGGTAGIVPGEPTIGQINFSVERDGYSFRMPREAFERLARQMRRSLDEISTQAREPKGPAKPPSK
jgi:hypothetical protein